MDDELLLENEYNHETNNNNNDNDNGNRTANRFSTRGSQNHQDSNKATNPFGDLDDSSDEDVEVDDLTGSISTSRLTEQGCPPSSQIRCK